MKKNISLLLCLALVLGFIFSNTTSALALTSGYCGISDYTGCDLGNRAGSQYVTNLQKAIKSKATQSFKLVDGGANKYVFQSSWAYSVDFFAYSGHGLSINTTSKNALHFRAVGNTTNAHTHTAGTNYDLTNAYTNEVRLTETLKYATMYTCNNLTNNGSTSKQTEIYKMFEGGRLVLGFASQMYLDSREGTLYGQGLVGTKTIKNAFMDAANKYQTQRSTGDAIARCVGYTSASGDKLTNPGSSLTSGFWYKNYNSAYSIIETNTIPHNGIII